MVEEETPGKKKLLHFFKPNTQDNSGLPSSLIKHLLAQFTAHIL
jgi:hypothetical protein